MKMKCWCLNSQLTSYLNRNFPFYVKKYSRIKKRRLQKLMTLLINQILFYFEMRNYASFAEMNMILMTITKATLFRGGFRGGGGRRGRASPLFCSYFKELLTVLFEVELIIIINLYICLPRYY